MGHTEPVFSAADSPDGRFIVTASWDSRHRHEGGHFPAWQKRLEVSRVRQQPENKTGGENSPASRADQGSTSIQFSWGKWNQVEHPHHLNTLYFTNRIEFPQRELLTQMTATHS